MTGPDRPADKIRKLVTLAAAGDTHETAVARTKAHEAIAKLDTELLDTLAGQRKQLLEELREESRRLHYERATKQDTGELVSRAMMLFNHYERCDALIAAVMLTRIEAGHALTSEERQQLDGPVEDVLDRWAAAARERRKADREKRKAQRRADRVAARARQT